MDCFSVVAAVTIFCRARAVGEGFLKGGLEKDPRDRDLAEVESECDPRRVVGRVVELLGVLGTAVVKLDIVGRSGTAGTARRIGPTRGCRPDPATRPTGREGTAGTGSGRIF